jgi:hypothetical protein
MSGTWKFVMVISIVITADSSFVKTYLDGVGLDSEKATTDCPLYSIFELSKVTVTMPIHPLRGEALELIRVEGNRGCKCRHIVPLTQGGRQIRIPESWTGRCVSVGRQQTGGKQAKLALTGLQ